MHYRDIIGYTPEHRKYVTDDLFSKEIGTIYALYDYLLSEYGSNPFNMVMNFKNQMNLTNILFIYSPSKKNLYSCI